ncbi:MAG: helix-turn-helix transcriptional regulator [Prevotella sp.]|nr:helix-turn-helix transcriptional regulator [Candidatus Prevotella equi]
MYGKAPGASKFDPDDTIIARAIYSVVFKDAWKNLCMENCGEGKLRGDTINSFATLFSYTWDDKFTPRWNPDEGLSQKRLEYNKTCFTIGNMMVLPDRRIGDWSINKYRGCHDEWHDYMDRSLEGIRKVLLDLPNKDEDLADLVELNKDDFKPYFGEEGWRKFIINNMLEDYVDENYLPVIKTKGYTYWRIIYTNKERFFKECNRYIDDSTNIIMSRGKRMIEILKQKIIESTNKESNMEVLKNKEEIESVWILVCDTKRYDIHTMFKEDGYCLWNQRKDFQVGDIVYIYEKKPVSKIVYKTIVEAVNVKPKMTYEGFYSRGYNKDHAIKLKLLSHNKGNRLQYNELHDTFGFTGMKLLGIPHVKDQKFIDFAEDVFAGNVEDIPAPPTLEELYEPMDNGTMLEHIKHKMDACKIRDSHLAKQLGISSSSISTARNGIGIKTENVLRILDSLGFYFVEANTDNTPIETNMIEDVVREKITTSNMRPTDIASLCSASLSVISRFKNGGVLPKMEVFEKLLDIYNIKVAYKNQI